MHLVFIVGSQVGYRLFLPSISRSHSSPDCDCDHCTIVLYILRFFFRYSSPPSHYILTFFYLASLKSRSSPSRLNKNDSCWPGFHDTEETYPPRINP
jgi:hypothetical protein